MLSNIKKASYLTIVYSIGSLASKLTGFVLLPIYSTHLQMEDFGTYILIEPVWQLLSAILGLSLPTALLRWISPEKNIHKQKSLVFTVLTAIIVILTFFNLLAYPVNELLDSNGLYQDAKLKVYLDYSFAIVTFDIINLLILNLFRFHEKPWQYIFLNVLKLTINLLLNIYLIVYAGWGIESILISQLAGSIALVIFSARFLAKNITFQFQFQELKEMVSYGFPLIFTTLSAIILSMNDRFIINEYFSRQETALYGVGYKIGGIINIFLIQPFQLGFLPFAYKMNGEPDARLFFARFFTYFALLISITGLVFSLFTDELLAIFTAGSEGYQAARVVIPLIVFSFVFRGIQYYFSLGLHYVKKTKYNAWIVIASASVSVALNFILVPRYGIIGAAFTSLISVIIMAGLFFVFAQKYYPITFEYKRLAIIMIVVTGVYFTVSSLTFNSQIISIIGKLFSVLLILPILYFMGFFSTDELKRIHGIINRGKTTI